LEKILEIHIASKENVPLILGFIRQFAEYGNVTHELIATEEILEETLFGHKPYAEVIISCLNSEPVGYALFSHNFSTLLGRPGLYLVDIFVIPEARKQGVGRSMLAYLADLAIKRNCGRFEWSVLPTNHSAIRLYEDVGARPLDQWKIYRISGLALDKLAEENS
jgi:GNAT superfamily N-acetyltransferase